MLKQFLIPDTLQKYLDEKNIQGKVLHLLSLMSPAQVTYITDFVVAERPSVQSFRIFVEKLRDFSPDVTDKTYNKTEFNTMTDRRTEIHKDIDALMLGIQKSAYVKNLDNFETNRLHWTFTTDNVHDFLSVIKKLNGAAEDVEKLYKKLEGE